MGQSVMIKLVVHLDEEQIWTGMFRISSNAKVLEAEALGIYKTIVYCEENGIGSIHIHTDSSAVLLSISAGKESCETVKMIRNKILEGNVGKGNSGVRKNEDADAKAKRAMQWDLVDCTVKFSKRQVANMLMKEMEDRWQERWISATKGRKFLISSRRYLGNV